MTSSAPTAAVGAGDAAVSGMGLPVSSASLGAGGAGGGEDANDDDDGRIHVHKVCVRCCYSVCVVFRCICVVGCAPLFFVLVSVFVWHAAQMQYVRHGGSVCPLRVWLFDCVDGVRVLHSECPAVVFRQALWTKGDSRQGRAERKINQEVNKGKPYHALEVR